MIDDIERVVSLEPLYEIYSPNQITACALFGGPLAITWLMALNDHRLGCRGRGLDALILGLLATAAFLAATHDIPRSDLHAPIHLVPPIVAYYVANAFYGEPLRRHLARAGRVATNASAAGIALASCALSIAVLVGLERW